MLDEVCIQIPLTLSCSALSLQPPKFLALDEGSVYLGYPQLSFPVPHISHTGVVHIMKGQRERFYDCVWTCFVTGMFRNLSTHCHLHIGIKSTLKIWLPSIGSFSHHGPRDNSKAEASALLKRTNFFRI